VVVGADEEHAIVGGLAAAPSCYSEGVRPRRTTEESAPRNGTTARPERSRRASVPRLPTQPAPRDPPHPRGGAGSGSGPPPPLGSPRAESRGEGTWRADCSCLARVGRGGASRAPLPGVRASVPLSAALGTLCRAAARGPRSVLFVPTGPARGPPAVSLTK
jgi:hypothetical protein